MLPGRNTTASISTHTITHVIDFQRDLTTEKGPFWASKGGSANKQGMGGMEGRDGGKDNNNKRERESGEVWSKGRDGGRLLGLKERKQEREHGDRARGREHEKKDCQKKYNRKYI